jgi:methionyl-tRNA synthetase
VGELYNAVKLKAALTETRRLSQRINQYLNEKAPWKTIKDDPTAAATSLYVALQAIEWLAILWAPVLPFSSEKVRHYLGYDGPFWGRQFTQRIEDGRGSHLVLRYDNTAATGRWEAGTLLPGQRMRAPEALFVKLDEAMLAEKVQAIA